MPWLQVDTLLRTAPDELETAIESLGALAVWFTDAGDEQVLEPLPGETRLWSATVLSALFPATATEAGIRAALSPLLDPDELRFRIVDDRDWAAEWQRSLKPLRFGKRLWVVQSDNDSCPDHAIVVRLTPGLAFGTGEHATTAMCLTWLDSLGAVLQGSSVLDYGCGAGLLTIAAIRLGADRLTATDIDPQALDATRRNASINNCSRELHCCLPTALTDMQHDILVANILSNTLIELGPELRERVRDGGHIALSGILYDQADAVRAAWSDWAQLDIGDRTDNWVLLTGRKHGKAEA